MSLKPQAIGPIPEETARIARAAYPKGNIYLQLRDILGTIYEDEQFADLFPRRGQPAESPWRLALVCVMQFREGLSDRQAADAVRGRLDWKYLLGLELSDPGFDHTVLVEFRQRLLSGKQDLLLFDLLLTRLGDEGYLKARGRQRSDSTHVLAKIRALNRIEGVGEPFRAALNSLAVAAPEWLTGQVQEDWVDRYEQRVEDYRLPSGKQAREAYAVVIGKDGVSLLSAIYAAQAPVWLAEIPAVETLRRVWVQNFYWEEGELRWRDASNVPAAGQCIDSPYDPEAHYAQKRTTSWVGYKVHLTKTCDDESPHLITHVQTTPAPLADDAAVPLIHEALAQRDLLPGVHLVDTGYVDAAELVSSQQDYEVELLSLPAPRLSLAGAGRDRVRGFPVCRGLAERVRHLSGGTDQQQLDTRSGSARQPGHQNQIRDAGLPSLPKPRAVYPQSIGLTAPSPHGASARTISGLASCARQRQTTKAFKTTYAARAGIEGTLSQGIRAFGLRQARYRGLEKVHLQQILTATALNLCRMNDWLTEQPRAQTRQAAFVRLVKKRA